RLASHLDRNGLEAVAIHSDRSQPERTRALEAFKNGDVRILVATDVAARGLDIEDLPHVVNFELPPHPQDYIHRIGRTGRAGATGDAISLVSLDEAEYLRAIQRLLRRAIPWAVEARVRRHPCDRGDRLRRGRRRGPGWPALPSVIRRSVHRGVLHSRPVRAMPRIVPAEGLMTANSLNQTPRVIATVVGSAA